MHGDWVAAWASAARERIKKNIATHAARKTGKTDGDMKTNYTQRPVGGVPIRRLAVPLQIIVGILHLTIVLLILLIGRSSAELSAAMQSAARYTQEATSLLAGSNVLSDTASTFVMRPTRENGEVNTYPLISYVGELSNPRRGGDILTRFRTYNVDEEVLRSLETAASSADYLLQSQLHALALAFSVYPPPETLPLKTIPVVELSEAERQMTDSKKMAEARLLLLGDEYSQNKQSVFENVSACVERLQSTSAQRAAEIGRKVAMLRFALWAVTGTIILILCITSAVLHATLLRPLSRFVQLMPKDQPLDEQSGVREVRLVASTYNDVLKRRNELDSILRSAAEKDALTGLANRYRFQQYCLELEEADGSVAVLLFDINFLKQTNDTLGHTAGDRLICAAAKCISDSFGEENTDNCFRLGGDEFAALVRGRTQEEIGVMIDNFRAAEKAEGVSISMGFAYSFRIGEPSLRALMDEADEKMYKEKLLVHERVQAAEAGEIRT